MNRDSGVTHPKFRMWQRPDGIVQMTWVARVAIGLEDATAAISAMNELTGARRRPFLVDLHDSGQPSRLARIEFTSRDDLVSAVALIVGTPFSRITGNFFLRVSRPQYPVRLFDEEASALARLRSFVGAR
jgi:hypothetical protein